MGGGRGFDPQNSSLNTPLVSFPDVETETETSREVSVSVSSRSRKFFETETRDQEKLKKLFYQLS